MGWRFSIKDINIVGYLTSNRSKSRPEPRIKFSHLKSFLLDVREARENDHLRVFISSRPGWPNEIAAMGKNSLERLFQIESAVSRRSSEQAVDWGDDFKQPQTDYLVKDELEFVLSELRKEFSSFDIYGLLIDREQGEMTKVAYDFAMATRERGLILIPNDLTDKRGVKTLDFFDPLPSVSTLAESDISRPGILFWMRNDRAAYQTDLRKLSFYLGTLKDVETHDLRKVFYDLSSRGDKNRRQVIHLSDLHFGTEPAILNRTRLKDEIRKQAHRCDRVVITGDLFESLKKRDAIDFHDFRNDLAAITRREVLVVPGNHDQKFLGNSLRFLGKNAAAIADLEWTNFFIDDFNRTVYFGFDSSSESNFAAKGLFSKTQRDLAENAYRSNIHIRPEIEDYFRIALIHHHPFSFDEDHESFVQRGLRMFGFTDKSFLAMDNSEAFIEWCANMEIPLILHGHKHVQRHFKKRVTNKTNKSVVVESVGCGTSLGAERYPLTYNVVSYDPNSQTFGTTFYEDDCTGGGFVAVKVAMQIKE